MHVDGYYLPAISEQHIALKSLSGQPVLETIGLQCVAVSLVYSTYLFDRKQLGLIDDLTLHCCAKYFISGNQFLFMCQNHDRIN